jgi:hypothetical protein
MRAKLREIRDALWQHRHAPLNEQGSWLRQVVGGYFAYHAVPTNGTALSEFRGLSFGTGCGRSVAGARVTRRRGPQSIAWRIAGFQETASFINGRANASPSNTQGGSRMREFRSYGSVRGARSNARPYCDPQFRWSPRGPAFTRFRKNDYGRKSLIPVDRDLS